MTPDKLRPGSAAAGLLWKLDKSKTNQWDKKAAQAANAQRKREAEGKSRNEQH